jgi:hypothetical protein
MKYIFVLLVSLFQRSLGFLPSDSFRRSILPRATTLASSITSFTEMDAESPRTLIRKGMQSFRDGDVSSSLAYFDRADNAVPDGSLRPFLWQRGISYYYLNQFRDGSDQVIFQ